MEKNLLVLKELLEPSTIKFINAWLQYQNIDKLDDIVNKYNNTYQSTIKMKSVDLKSSTHIDYCKKVNDKDPKFKIGDIPNWLCFKFV